MKIPLNKIQKQGYTKGNEYMDKLTYEKYQGQYFIFNNKIYKGKPNNDFLRELVNIEQKSTKKQQDIKESSYFNVPTST